MAKSPEPGKVKTRLVADGYPATWITPLVAAFLMDTATVVSHPVLTARQNAEVLLSLEGHAIFLPEPLSSMPYVAQSGNSLGERLVHLCEQSFSEGVEHLVIIGSDTPHLPVTFVQEAFGRLMQGADAVFGPADDGGYYLVGLRKPLPCLFQEIPWSTGEVLQATLKIAAQEGINIALLPSFYDIDTGADLRRLMTDLQRQVVTAPATASFLEVHSLPESILLRK